MDSDPINNPNMLVVVLSEVKLTYGYRVDGFYVQ